MGATGFGLWSAFGSRNSGLWFWVFFGSEPSSNWNNWLLINVFWKIMLDLCAGGFVTGAVFCVCPLP